MWIDVFFLKEINLPKKVCSNCNHSANLLTFTCIWSLNFRAICIKLIVLVPHISTQISYALQRTTPLELRCETSVGQLAHILWQCATIQLPSNIPCSSHASDVARRVPECFSVVESTRDHFVAAPHSSCPFAPCFRPQHVYSYAHNVFLIFKMKWQRCFWFSSADWSKLLVCITLNIYIYINFIGHVQFRLKILMNLSYCSTQFSSCIVTFK